MDLLTESEALSYLAKADLAHIAVIDMGEPHVTPIAFVLDRRRVLFRSGPGRRLNALRRHPAVSLEACYLDRATGNWLSVIGSGRAEEFSDDLMSKHTVELLTRKYRQVLGTPLQYSGLQPLPAMPHVIGVAINQISGACSRREAMSTDFDPRSPTIEWR